MGFDEVGTARTLREHRKVTDALVTKHGGRLVKTPKLNRAFQGRQHAAQ
jgi:hypothetical protein